MWEGIRRSVCQVNLIRRLPLVGVVCCLITLAVGAWTCLNVYNRTQAEVRERVADFSAVLAEQASHHVRVADILLRNVQSQVRNADIRAPEQFMRHFRGAEGLNFLRAQAASLPASDGLALFGADGTMVYRRHDGAFVSVADRDYFRWLRDHRTDELLFAGPWISRATGLMSFYAVRRLESADGGFLGIAVVGLSTQYFSDCFRSLAQTRDIAVSMLRADGALLVRFPPLPEAARLPPLSVKPEFTVLDKVAQGGGTLRAAGLFVDRETIMAVHPVPDYALAIEVTADVHRVLHTWRMQSVYTFVATPTLAIALLALFMGLARSFRAQERHAAALTAHAEALRASEERLDRAQENAALGSWEHDIDTGTNIWSRNLYRISGIDPSADISEAALEQMLGPEELAVHRVWLAELAAGRQPPPRDVETLRPDGTASVLQIDARPIIDPDGRIRRLAGTTRDVTQLRLLERGLIQSQKMEAIGNLAGGIAHDFNNFLGVIIGNLDLLRTLLETGSEAMELCDEALDGAMRGAELVKRMLAFARHRPLQPQIVDVNAQVADVGRLLRRALGEGIVLRMDLGKDVGSTMVDPVQFQASLVNLGTNARDAMPSGGRLYISTHAVSVTGGNRAHHEDLAPGLYAVITVRDTGSGMEPEVLKCIFEPFFTTKAPDRGTGLGLSMVFGFVSQSGGRLSVRSEPGVGSSFRLYLPRIAHHGGEDRAVSPVPVRQAATGDVVLLVDDNTGFRRASVRQLSALGYRVREAPDAAAALRVLERGERIDILLTDLVLTGSRDGIGLAEAASRVRPNLHVVLMSGWIGIRDAKARLSRWGRPLLGKPFFTDELAAALRGERPRQPVW